MEITISTEDFTIEKRCEFKGRQYLVRDNGAVKRLPKEGCKANGYDNIWTFGKKDATTGYMMLSGVRIHQIVATAFHGAPIESTMVVDHKDTNRCNNRPENLAWVTRFENVMNNPITRNRIALACGSVEAFLEDPSKFRHKLKDKNISWMCTVTKEAAAKCKQNLERWAADDRKKESSGKGLGDWIFGNVSNGVDSDSGFGDIWDKEWYKREPRKSYYQIQKEQIEAENMRLYEEAHALKESLTINALQNNWVIPTEFFACPKTITDTPLQDYFANIRIGELFCGNEHYQSFSYKADLSDDKSTLAVITTSATVKGSSGFCLTCITFENGKFIHTNEGSYFDERGAEKYMTLALGREWTGGDVIDDYC